MDCNQSFPLVLSSVSKIPQRRENLYHMYLMSYLFH